MAPQCSNTHIVRAIDPAVDAPAVATVMMTAQYTDEHWRLSYPILSLPEIIVGLKQRLPFNLISSRHAKRHQMALDLATGKPVGYARWILPAEFTTEGAGKELVWPEARTRDITAEEKARFEKSYGEGCEGGVSRGVRMDLQTELGWKLEDAENKIMEGPGPWLSLDYMTVHPDHQRRGVGGLLLESGLKVANERGWKTVVMSQPQGIRLYEKHGFITSTVVEQDDSKFGGDGKHIMVFMVKDPEVQT